MSAKPGFADLYTPKLITVLREGYGLADLRADVVSGLTVAIVALPLSMAIAIASGTTPDRGLYAAIVGGFLVSLLGGSRFQIGGPAGAFIALVAATVAEQGLDGLLLATLISGVLLMLAGLLRIGTYIRFIPYPVIVGFTAGIGVIILTSQLQDLLGLVPSVPVPAEVLPKLQVLADALPTLSIPSTAIAALGIAGILALRWWRPAWPGLLIVVVAAAVIVALFRLPVETIGSRFGGIPGGLPLPQLPPIDAARIAAVMPHAIAFTLLGAIESLLSAVVADGMTGRRHRSNSELVAQGVANIGSSLFGGICVTGTIARTATNVRAGARGPVSGMLHSLFLLSFMVLAAPLASYIPLPVLAAVLVVVAWNMIETHAIRTLVRSSPGDTVVLASTFLLTVFRDLTEGILVGFAIGSVLFIQRMASIIGVEGGEGGDALVPADAPDSDKGHYDARQASDPGIVVYRIRGALFFGAAATVGAVLDHIGDQHHTLVLDLSGVPFLDSTGANALEGAIVKAGRRGVKTIVRGANADVRRVLLQHRLGEHGVQFAPSLQPTPPHSPRHPA